MVYGISNHGGRKKRDGCSPRGADHVTKSTESIINNQSTNTSRDVTAQGVKHAKAIPDQDATSRRTYPAICTAAYTTTVLLTVYGIKSRTVSQNE